MHLKSILLSNNLYPLSQIDSGNQIITNANKLYTAYTSIFQHICDVLSLSVCPKDRAAEAGV